MLDLIVKNATLQDGTTDIDIACHDGKIVDLGPRIAAQATVTIDAQGLLVVPPFVDAHFHADGTLLHGNPFVNESGELYEGIDIWNKIKKTLTVEDVKHRARKVFMWAIARGTLYIRAQTDICDPELRGVQALIELREELKPYLDLQIVAFPQDGYLRDPQSRALMARAIEMGVDVIGGIPDYELTAPLGNESVRQLCELADKHGLLVDMHIDQTPDPQSRQIEAITAETGRLELGARASASHCPSMANFHDYYATKLIAQIAQVGMNIVVCPMTAATCWGVMTRVSQLYDAGVNVAFGYDCAMDPWYPMGTCDMLDVAQMAIVFGRMLSEKKKHKVFNSITYGGAQALNIADYGIAKGKKADLIVVQASSAMEAVRIRPPRLAVIRRGHVIAAQEKQLSRLTLGGKELEIDFTIENLMGASS
jgi:cytosine/creatinine deaminase